MASTLINDTSTDTYIMFDPATEDNITESYGLLANTIEELMFDLFDQEQILASYLLQCVMYRTLLHFNNTFAVRSHIYQQQCGVTVANRFILNRSIARTCMALSVISITTT